MTTRLFSNPRPHFTLDDGATSNINGKLYFYEPGIGSTTLKYVYSRSPFTTANRLTNPVNLDGNGFAPTIRLDGDYRVKLTDVNGVTIWDVPNYQEAEPEGQYTEWSASLTYAVNDIVRYTDGNYYQSITSNNTGNTPSSSSSFWVKIFFITLWNTSRSYAVGEYAERSGEIYRSLTAHSGSDPLTSRTNWERVTAGNFDEWISGYTYEVGDSVRSSGKYYQCIQASTGNTPATSPAYWSAIKFVFEYNSTQTYSENDAVYYNGRLYNSLVDSNLGNTPSSSPSDWEILTITAEDLTPPDLGFTAWVGEYINTSMFVGTMTLSTAITESAWETIGPTGSGADYEWSALDDLPANVEAVKIGVQAYSERSGTTDAEMSMDVRLTGAGSPTLVPGNLIFTAKAYGGAANNNALIAGCAEATVPVNASNIFRTYWVSTNETSGLLIYLIFRGYTTR